MKEGKDKRNELSENIEISTKAIERVEKSLKTLEEIEKNDDEYKILLYRKESGESIEDLIKQNRKYGDILAEKNKENSMEFKKWQQSEEGKKARELLEEEQRIDPDLDNDIKLVNGLKLANESKKNEEKYEKLLGRREKGEYVDDLIKQNLYTAIDLAEQNKKGWGEEDRRINPEIKRQIQAFSQLRLMSEKTAKGSVGCFGGDPGWDCFWCEVAVGAISIGACVLILIFFQGAYDFCLAALSLFGESGSITYVCQFFNCC